MQDTQPTKGENTRGRIVASADDLFYRQGYEHTSFADIAMAVNISRGNFYHHFRTKDEILDAVIGKRLTDRQEMLERWEAESEAPAARIRCFIRILVTNRAKILRHGCPVGTLCTELTKLGHPAQTEANRVFSLFHAWLRKQFVALGRKADASALAMHLLARSQGIAVLANAIGDAKFIDREVEALESWLEAQKADASTISARSRSALCKR